MIFRKGVRLQQLVIKVWCQASNHLKLIRKGNSLVPPRTCCCSVPQSCLTPVTPWTEVQGFPVLPISQSLLRFMSIESEMLSNHLIPLHPGLLNQKFWKWARQSVLATCQVILIHAQVWELLDSIFVSDTELDGIHFINSTSLYKDSLLAQLVESACNSGDPGWIPGSGRCPREGNDNPLQYSCLENPMDGGAWWATVYTVAMTRTRLSDFTFTIKRSPRALTLFSRADTPSRYHYDCCSKNYLE